MSSLVILKNNEPQTTSLIVSEQLNRTHKGIIRLIRDRENDFNEFGTLRFENAKSKGRPTEFVYLNEQHLTFLIMMLRVKQSENDKVLQFKKKITKEFFKMRKWIVEKQQEKSTQLYTKARTNSKFVRLMETDVIKEFVEYAKKQGSNNADKYYIHFSNLAKAYFDIQINVKGQNFRELLSAEHLYKIATADNIIKTAIKAGMKNNLYYKDVYKLAKKKVEQGVELIGGKELIPAFTKLIRKED